ncbi:MAG: hypothetical protein E7369_06080, partial [Clostridiales bacterium]|nr:hypothetical protein [Clostridiales bacterium]
MTDEPSVLVQPYKNATKKTGKKPETLVGRSSAMLPSLCPSKQVRQMIDEPSVLVQPYKNATKKTGKKPETLVGRSSAMLP